MSKTNSSRTLALGAMFTAIVVVLQLLGSFIHFGPFSISLVLVPIVIGAALCGPVIGAWLGFVFGFTVLLSGDAGAFLAVNVPGTIITVLLKGTLCGLVAGVVYSALKKVNEYLAVLISAIVCPVVNTGVFLICCALFFMPTIREWAGGTSVFKFMILGLVGGNFLFELIFNIILSSAIIRIINAVKRN